jgi:hypothetical protein
MFVVALVISIVFIYAESSFVVKNTTDPRLEFAQNILLHMNLSNNTSPVIYPDKHQINYPKYCLQI